MAAALLIARSRLRQNLVATAVLILLAGLGGGVVFASVAGVRRADQGWAELQADNPEGDAVALVLSPELEFPVVSEEDLEDETAQVRSLPGVTEASRSHGMVATGRPVGETAPPSLLVVQVPLDRTGAALAGRPIIVSGRPADPSRADEAVVDEELAKLHDLEAGDPFEVTPFTAAQFESLERGLPDPARGPLSVVTVVGIVRFAHDVLSARTDDYAYYLNDPYLRLTPAWWAANDSDVSSYGIAIGIDLDRGPAGRDAFAADMAALFGERALVAPGLEFELGIQPEVREAVSGRITTEGRALAAFAVAVALAVVAIVGQSLVRQLRSEDGDRDALAALGLTPRDLAVAGLLRAAVVAMGAAVVACGAGLALSGLVPIGSGARVLREQGPSVDLAVLVVGSAAMVAGVLLLALAGSVRVSWGSRSRPSGRTTLADRLSGAGAALAPTVGLRMAFDRSGAGQTGRAAVGATALAVAAVVAATTLLASYGSLAGAPDRLGQVWDASVGNFSSPEGVREGVDSLQGIDGVEAVSGELWSPVEVDGESTSAVGYSDELSSLVPTVTSGRAPEGEAELLVGTVFARQHDLELGDEVEVVLFPGDPPRPPFRVVGIGVAAAALVDKSPGQTVFVDGAVLLSGLDAVVPQVLLVRFAPDADEGSVVAQLDELFPDTVLRTPVLPRTVQTLKEVQALPIGLAVVVSLLGTGVVINALVGSVRRRRRDLAVLKVFGCRRRQVAAMVASQATAWALLALLIGIPVGLVVGSTAWRGLARGLGVASPVAMPPLAIVACLLGVLVLVNVVAVGPARAAARVSAAIALRAE